MHHIFLLVLLSREMLSRAVRFVHRVAGTWDVYEHCLLVLPDSAHYTTGKKIMLKTGASSGINLWLPNPAEHLLFATRLIKHAS